MKRIDLHLLLTIFVAAIALTACGGSDPEPNPDSEQTVKPDVTVDNPVGTICLSMRNESNGRTCLDGFYIGKDDNFTNGYFADLGEMKGLGNVVSIPTTGWARKVAVIPGHGYVAYSEETGNFLRIYVTDYITAAGTSGIIGADIKYQKPFKGLNEKLKPETEALTFSSEGGSEGIMLLNSTVIPFDITSDAEWCHARKAGSLEFSFLTDALTIDVDATSSTQTDNAVITLKTMWGVETQIRVTRSGSKPFLNLPEHIDPLTAEQCESSVFFTTNMGLDEASAVSSSNWLTTEIVDNIQKVRQHSRAIKHIAGRTRTTDDEFQGAHSYEILLNATSNYEKSDREATVTVKVANISGTLSITQKGLETESSEKSRTVPSEAGAISITLRSSIKEGFSVHSDAAWCKATLGTGTRSMYNLTLVAEYDNNYSRKERVATITVCDPDGHPIDAYTITQEGSQIETGATDISLPSESGNTEINLSTSIKSGYSVRSDVNWCRVSMAEATRSMYPQVISVSYDANYTQSERTAYVSVVDDNGDTVAVYKLTQKKGNTDVGQTDYEVPFMAGSQTIEFSSDFNYGLTVETDAEWIKARLQKNTRAAYAHKIVISYDGNPDKTARQAHIIVMSPDKKKIATYTITQQAGTIELNFKGQDLNLSECNMIYVYAREYTYSIKVTTSLENWTPTVNQSWMSYKVSGSTIELRLETSNKTRDGEITFGNTGLKFRIRQLGYDEGANYTDEGKAGEGKLAYLDHFTGKGLVIKELQACEWSTKHVFTGADNEEDGIVNMNKIAAIPDYKTQYPAFAAVMALNNGISGWYLPAAKDIVWQTTWWEFLDEIWTSTEADAERAYVSHYVESDWGGYDNQPIRSKKTDKKRVFAVRWVRF